MSIKVVVGAGATGVSTALELAAAGEKVRLASLRGTGPRHRRIELVKVDANDRDALAAVVSGATTLFNCAMPPYDRWPELWPPLAASLLVTAERAGADYVMLGNTYGYGPVDGPLTEDLALEATTSKGRVRAQMWLDAKAATDAGRVKATEVRALDFLGRDAISPYSLTIQAALLAGEQPRFFPADLDAPHSWTYTRDAARTLIAASESDESWGRAWHVPSTSHASVRVLTERIAKAAGLDGAAVVAMSHAELHDAAADDPILREIVEVLYLFEKPAILDSAETQRKLDVEPTPLNEVLNEILTAARANEHSRP